MLQSFKMALKSIWGNKMRSFLTMLGIIIGVASVIILVSIVNGYMSYMVESFSSMGVNQITARYTPLPSRSIDVDEVYDFYEEHSDLYENMSPTVSVSVTVKHDNDTMDSTEVGGYSEDYLAIKDYQIAYGRNLLYSDMEARRKVAVIGSYVASELYGGSQNAVGDTIKLNGESYTIVGVVEQQTENSSDLEDGCTDDFVWIPYSRAVKMARNAVINSYVFTSRDINETETCTQELKTFLYEKMKSDSLYTVTAMSSLLDSLNDQINMMSMMLGGIAGISLLVAGVGVMNIMLVSVTERTREIGIRKARCKEECDHAAVRDRGACDECHRRDHRDRDRCSREHRDWQAHGDRSASDHDGGRDLILGLCGDRTDLRIYAGEPGSKAESDRRAENGLRWAHLLHQEKKGYVWQSCHGFAPKRQNILS